MPPEETQQNGTPPATGNNPTPGVTVTDGSPQPVPAAAQTNGGGTQQQQSGTPSAQQPANGVHVLSQSAFKKMKEKERERGKSEALKEMALAAGFSSPEEMQKAMAKLKAQPASTKGQQGKPQGQPKPGAQAQATGPKPGENPNKTITRQEREIAALREENGRLRQQLGRADQRRKQLQQHSYAREAEFELQRVATLQGINDTDYALRLFTRAMEGKSEEELAKVDEAAFFKDLRKSHPYLFGEVVRPANTGTGTGAPPAPNAREATTTTAQGSQVDARKMKPEEFQQHLRARGLNPSM